MLAKIKDGLLKGKILKVTGVTGNNVTVEYEEVCFSIHKEDCHPVVHQKVLTWEDIDSHKNSELILNQ